MELDNNPFYLQALQYIADNDLDSLEPGRHDIDGDNIFVNIVDSALKTPFEAKLEVHNVYIDIQVPLSGPESFGVKPRRACQSPEGEFDPSRDIQFFSDPIVEADGVTPADGAALVTVQPGEAITFDPDTAHAPLIGEGNTHKAIFKVKVI